MKKRDVIEAVEAKLDSLGVSKSLMSVRAVPSCVEVKVVAANSVQTLKLTSGINSTLLAYELEKLERMIHDAAGRDPRQMDLEEYLTA